MGLQEDVGITCMQLMRRLAKGQCRSVLATTHCTLDNMLTGTWRQAARHPGHDMHAPICRSACLGDRAARDEQHARVRRWRRATRHGLHWGSLLRRPPGLPAVPCALGCVGGRHQLQRSFHRCAGTARSLLVRPRVELPALWKQAPQAGLSAPSRAHWHTM